MIVIEIILLTYFMYVTGYTMFFGICANLDRKKTPRNAGHHHKSKFCILIPAYKEDAVIIKTAKRALDQKYPTSLFDVVVIADKLKGKTLKQLGQLAITTIPVSFKKSTKVKSLNQAMAQIGEGYDYGVILDADNIMDEYFLELVNNRFATGKYKAIQGQRKPKNQQNTLSYLDAVSESINTAIFRRGTSFAGLSSSISGSGFAVEYKLLKKVMSSMDSVGGFDKELEVLLVARGINVKYIHELVVYDEKVSNSAHFENQRKRWISSQYHYLAKYFKKGITALFSGSLSLFNSTILRNIQLPRLINLGLFTLLMVLALLLRDFIEVPYFVWIILFCLHTIAIFISIPKAFYSFRLLYSIVKLPMLFLRMVSAFFQLKKANKKFIHTPHEV